MSRCLLITYPGYPYSMSAFMPDNGLANLAGALFAAGHEALIADYSTPAAIRRMFPERVRDALRSAGAGKPDGSTLQREVDMQAGREIARIGEEVCALVRSWRPDCVGFKLWNGDGCLGSIALARRLRSEFPRLPIYGGGPHVTVAIRPIIEKTGRFAPLDEGAFDVLVESEGEELIPLLADLAVGKGAVADIPNAIYRDGEQIRRNPVTHVRSLDALAPPLYDAEVYPAMGGDDKLRIIPLDESRGCAYRCAFCIQPIISGRKVRLRSPSRVVDEMERCISRYGIGAFRFAGSATPGRLLGGIAEEILARGLRVRYTAFGRVNYMRHAVFERLKASGLEALFFGVESGSQRILDAMQKLARVSDIRATLRASRAAGVFTVASLIAPAPGETSDTWRETLALLEDVRPDAVPICPPGPAPGTPWFTDGPRYGIDIGEGYEEAALGAKYRLLVSGDPWDWPPLIIDGKSPQELSRQSVAMARDVEGLGILTMFVDEMFLMTRYCSLSPREFRDRTQRWLCAGEYEAVASLVAEINSNIRSEARSWCARPAPRAARGIGEAAPC